MSKQRMEASDLKAAAVGRWPDILAALGGIDRDTLFGFHHPCPKCGGTDRFSLVDADAGALLCRKCFCTGNGDGLAALCWLRGWSLPEAIDKVAEYLGLSNTNGHSVSVTETLKNTGENGVLVTGAAKKPPPKQYETRTAAVAAVARAVGAKPSTVWPYHDAQGNETAAVCRFGLPDGTKTYRPVSKHGDGWAVCGPDPPRPLYRLPELADATRVFVCEGEKAADAGRSVGLDCTTSMNGALAPRKTDWTPLAGKDVVLCPDADEPGEAYIEAVAGILAGLEPALRLRVLRLDGLEEGGDLFDWLELRDAHDPKELAETLNTLADNAPGWTPTPSETEPDSKPAIKAKTQQRATTATWQPFPVEALPEPVAGFIRAGSKAIGCDSAYLTLPLLAGLASAIGNSRRIQLKAGWEEPPIVWTAVVAESGTQKSPAMELALRPIRERQRVAMREHAERMAEWESRVKLYEKDFSKWKRAKADTLPPVKPEEPTAVRVWTDDATMEALAVLLLQNPNLLCARDELAGWLGSFDRYSGGKGGADVAKWLECWGGRSIVFDRKTGHPRTIYVPRASVCLAGCIQPGALKRCMGPEYYENGLAARLLLACPPRIPKRWTEAVVDWTVTSAMEAVFDSLYALEPETEQDFNAEPVAMRLDDTAKKCWVDFYNSHAQEAAKLSGELAAVWAKLEGYAARLALVVHLVRVAAGDGTASAETIDAQSIASGVTLARWFGNEARRVYSMLAETDEDEGRRQLAELIGRLGGSTTANELRRRTRRFATNEEAETALAELVKAGAGEWEWASPGEAGGRPTRLFRLNTSVTVS